MYSENRNANSCCSDLGNLVIEAVVETPSIPLTPIILPSITPLQESYAVACVKAPTPLIAKARYFFIRYADSSMWAGLGFGV